MFSISSSSLHNIETVFILWYRVCFQRVSAICSSINDELSLSTFCFSASSHSNVNIEILLRIIVDWLRNSSSVLVNLILNFQHLNIPEWSEFWLGLCLLVWMLKDFLSFSKCFLIRLVHWKFTRLLWGLYVSLIIIFNFKVIKLSSFVFFIISQFIATKGFIHLQQ